MNKFRTTLILLSLIAVLLMNSGFVASQTGDTPSDTPELFLKIACLLCQVFRLIFYVASAITALVILVAGVKWIGSADDPGARGSAKTTIVHAIIGLIIVLVATFLVSFLVGSISNAEMAPLGDFISGCTTTCTTPETAPGGGGTP